MDCPRGLYQLGDEDTGRVCTGCPSNCTLCVNATTCSLKGITATPCDNCFYTWCWHEFYVAQGTLGLPFMYMFFTATGTAVILFILLDFSFKWNAEVLSAGTTITWVQTSFVNKNVHQIITTRQQNHWHRSRLEAKLKGDNPAMKQACSLGTSERDIPK